MPGQDVVPDIWNERLRWSEAADSLQLKIKRWRLAQLAFAVTGTALTTAAATMFSQSADVQLILGGIGALTLAAVPFISQYFLSREMTDRWPRARSVSEGLKSEIFKYRAGVAPYDGPDPQTGTTPPQKLANRFGEIQNWARDLLVYLPAAPKRKSDAPPELTPDLYLKLRVNAQIHDYYSPSAEKNYNKAKLFRYLSVLFLAIATGISALTAAGIAQTMGAWVAVATTIGAAFTAHSAINRYEVLGNVYAKHAGELKHLLFQWKTANEPEAPHAWSQFVSDCEETISVENRAWMARLVSTVDGLEQVLEDARGDQ